MTKKPTNIPEGLRAMLTEALRAYGLAHATQLQAERQTKAEQQKRLASLQARQQAQIQQANTNQQQNESIANARLERIGHLLSVIETVKKASSDLLQKAGVAHIAGAPLNLSEAAAPARDSNETVASLFTAAQLAYVDLKAALLRLAEAYIDQASWDEARRVLQPLFEDTKDPLYQNARDLFCETYYEPALATLTADNWIAAREGFMAVLKINSTYRGAEALLREAYTRPYKKALDAKRWEEARQPIQLWLDIHKDDKAFRDLLCETYYLSSEQTLQSGDVTGAIRELQRLALIDINYKKTLQRLEGFFTQQANKNAWDLATQIFVTLGKASTANPSILQVFETSQPLQAAIKAITELEEVWSSDFVVQLSHLVFSLSNSLIGLAYDDGSNILNCHLLVFDTLTGGCLSQGYLHMSSIDYIYFDDSDHYLYAYGTERAYGSQATLEKLDIKTNKTNKSTPSSKPPQFDQVVSSALLATIRREAKEALIASAASPNGLYVVAAYQGAKLVLYRKAPSL